MTTLLQLKMRKAELRNELQKLNEAGQIADDELFIEYQTVLNQLEVAEKQLLKPIDKCSRCKWLRE